MLSAESLGVAPYFTAVVLGTAATSVPDTILSYKDAMKGDYDDAVANAVGSNIFDICVALGLPLALYTGLQMIDGGSGSIPMDTTDTTSNGVQTLRIVLIIISIAIVGLFLAAPKEDEDGETMLQIGKRTWFCDAYYLRTLDWLYPDPKYSLVNRWYKHKVQRRVILNISLVFMEFLCLVVSVSLSYSSYALVNQNRRNLKPEPFMSQTLVLLKIHRQKIRIHKTILKIRLMFLNHLQTAGKIYSNLLNGLKTTHLQI